MKKIKLLIHPLSCMLIPKNSRTYIFIFVIAYSLFPTPLLPQSEKKANKAFEAKEYQKCYTFYQQHLETRNHSIHSYFKYAEAARHVNDYIDAEKYYIKVMEDGDSYLYPMAVFWLAQVKKNLSKYDEALELFKTFALNGIDDYYTNWAAKEIQTCQTLVNANEWDSTIQIDLLPDDINSDYSETGAVEMGNRLFFSSSQSVYKEDKQTPKRHLFKMMVSENLEKAKSIPNNFIGQGKHFCNTTFSKDWQRMYFTVCEYVNSEVVTCQIHFMDQDDKGRWERKTQALPKHINLPGYTATQPAIGYNLFTQKEVLFFVSDRPEGVGKLDIWYSEIEDNEFSEPVNLTSINTREDDITPFFHTDSQTLYFSSESHPGFGGFDIFSTMIKDNNWGKVKNAGMPINSSFDDLYFSKNTIGNRGYLSSNRLGTRFPRGMKEGSCLDIFRIYYKDKQVRLSKF